MENENKVKRIRATKREANELNNDLSSCRHDLEIERLKNEKLEEINKIYLNQVQKGEVRENALQKRIEFLENKLIYKKDINDGEIVEFDKYINSSKQRSPILEDDKSRMEEDLEEKHYQEYRRKRSQGFFD